MLGVGYSEIMIILLVALVVFGPARLPELAGQVGKWVREFRRMTADLTEEFEKTVAEADDIRKVVTGEVDSMRSHVASVGNSVKKDLKGAAGTAKPGLAAAKRPATAAVGKKPTVASLGGSGVKKAGSASTVKSGGVATKPATLPVATKADPLADVSFLDDEIALPVNGRLLGTPGVRANGKDQPSANGAGGSNLKADAPAASAESNGVPEGTGDDAVSRARRRRATAGYGRRV